MADSKYGKITTERGDIPEGEPLFVLRGQDVLAPAVVRYYADLVEATCPDGVEEAKKIRVEARRMRLWPHRKLPD
jgi:hypothetical protein